ncbi:MAG: hypothetical protein KJ971_05355 [Firmicutes bacterium]|nr:hypothetical protein [Bacillota bacterium]
MTEQILEFLMLICFGFSWPFACIKAYKSRTTKGVSIYSGLLILSGYAFGIAYKFTSGLVNYVLIAYFFNFTIVSIYCILYFRNLKIDKKTEKQTILN